MNPRDSHPWVDCSREHQYTLLMPGDASKLEAVAMVQWLYARIEASGHAPHVILVDGSQVRFSDPDTRQAMAEMEKARHPQSSQSCRAVAFVTPNPIVRAAAMVHDLIVGKRPYPSKSFSTRADAQLWLDQVRSSLASQRRGA